MVETQKFSEKPLNMNPNALETDHTYSLPRGLTMRAVSTISMETQTFCMLAIVPFLIGCRVNS